MRDEISKALLCLAETKVSSVLWNGPIVKADALMQAVQKFQGASYGGSWTNHVPSELALIWDELSQEAQLSAFLVAVSSSFRSEGAGDAL